MGVPILSVAVRPTAQANRERIVAALVDLAAEDPTLSVDHRQPDQVVICGIGELQLEIVVDRLRQQFGVDLSASRPSVIYKETITQAADGERVPVMLEPVMRLEVSTPDTFVDAVLSGLADRGAELRRDERKNGTAIIEAHARMAKLIGYAADLRARTRGRAAYSMYLDRYAPLPEP